MITNQDGLGSNNYSLDNFNLIQNLLLNILESQGIYFDKILICSHFESDNCFCRKPRIGLLVEYLVSQKIDLADSYVIGDVNVITTPDKRLSEQKTSSKGE